MINGVNTGAIIGDILQGVWRVVGGGIGDLTTCSSGRYG